MQPADDQPHAAVIRRIYIDAFDAVCGQGFEFHRADHPVPVALGVVGQAVAERARIEIADAVVDAQGDRMRAGLERADAENMGRAE